MGKVGRLEGWKDGEGWKNGRLEGWKVGRMEGWKNGSPLCPIQNFERRFRLGGLRSLAAVEVALSLVFSAHTLFDQRNFRHTTRVRRSVALQAKNRCWKTHSPLQPRSSESHSVLPGNRWWNSLRGKDERSGPDW